MGLASHRVGREKAQCMSCRMSPHSRPWTRGYRSGKRSSSPEVPQLGPVSGMPWRPRSVTGHASRKETIDLGVSAIFSHSIWTAVLDWAIFYSPVGYFRVVVISGPLVWDSKGWSIRLEPQL